MISTAGLESVKTLSDIQADLIPGGVLFIYVETDTIVWKRASATFDMDRFEVGKKLDNSSISVKAIRENRILNEKVPRAMYGKRLKIISIPVINGNNEAVGAFSILLPMLHRVAAAFEDFAPILSEMFHEGVFLYMSDLEKIAYRQSSQQFDIPDLSIGYELQEHDIAAGVIKRKKPEFVNIGAERFGVPVFVASYPLFDEDNGEEIVATLGIVTPKTTAAHLRDISGNLENGLSGISAAIEQLAASATDIHNNEQQLNSDIKDIIDLSEEINEISTFIKEIADETKMLGLNAAIEAARAGDSGRGFGVVAEEIRKLSEQSKSTVPRIKKLTDNIKERVGTASEKSVNSLHSSQEQAAATEEITASIEEITVMAEELNKMAKTL